MKDKENRSVVTKTKKSSSGGLSPTKKPLLKSNQSSPSKSSGLSTKVTREKSSRSLRSSLVPKAEQEKSSKSLRSSLVPKTEQEKFSRSLRCSLLSKTEQSSELASCKTQAPSKAKSASSGGTKDQPIVLSSGESEHKAPLRYSLRSQTKDRPIILSSGESDHEAPLPSLHPRTRMSEPKKNTAVEQPMEKPKATIKPFQIKKKVTEPIITQAKCLPDDDPVAPVKKYDSSLPPVKKISKSAIPPSKCQRVAPSQKNPLPTKPPPVQKITVQRPKQSSVAKAPTKRPIPPPPPPQPPPSFSIHSHLQARPHYYDNPAFNCNHSRQAPYYQYQRYGGGYSYYSYPVGGESSSASSYYSTHPLATSYSAPYYQ